MSQCRDCQRSPIEPYVQRLIIAAWADHSPRMSRMVRRANKLLWVALNQATGDTK